MPGTSPWALKDAATTSTANERWPKRGTPGRRGWRACGTGAGGGGRAWKNFWWRQITSTLAREGGGGAAPREDEKHPGAITAVLRRMFGQSAEGAAIKVRGHDDLLVYRARCCNPIRGEAIVGYVTRGKGVAVHAISCANGPNLMDEADRRIAGEWARPLKKAVSTYRASRTV